MASSIQILRSTISRERPLPSSLLEGQPAINLNATEPGLFFKASDGSLIKIGPAAITYDGNPPNTPPVGNPGHCVGELWLDASTTPNTLKIFDGSQWRVASSSNAVDTIAAGTGISTQRSGNTVTIANTGVTSLVAGSNISLSGSTGQVTISATGGGGGGGGAGSFVRWIYTASGGETSLSGSSNGVTLDYTPGLEEVFVNGVLITRGLEYSAITGSSITNLSPLTSGDIVTVTSMNPLSTVELPGQVSLLRWSVLASAGQTVLSGVDSSSQQLAYTAGFEEVYVNGAFLRRGVDYTATDGSVITLTSALALNDEVTVMAWSTFSVASPITTPIDSSQVLYKSLLSGGQSRTVENRLKEAVFVKDFGAIGDGVADDTAAIQAAISYVEGTDRVLYFGEGTFYVTPSGTISFGVYGTKRYCVKISNTAYIDATGATFLTDISDSVNANAFVFDQVSDGGWKGGKFLGLNPDQAPTRLLFEGASVVLWSCSSVEVSGLLSIDMRGGCLIFNSNSCSIDGCEGRRTEPLLHNGSFFTIYGSTHCQTRNCVSWGGCEDGDMFLFGTGTYNKISNCAAHNSYYGDPTATIIPGGNQGFGSDSSQDYSVIEGCYAYGHFYGIDAKTNSTYVQLINNVAVSNKVGLSARRGEGNAPVNTVEIRGNQIRPVRGNGNDSIFLGAKAHCILCGDTSTVKISDNIMGVGFRDGVCEFNGITVVVGAGTSAVGINNSPGVLISNNAFVFHQQFAAFNAYSTGKMVVFSGQWDNAQSGSQFYPLTITGNHFSPYTATQDYLITTYRPLGVLVSDNDFGAVTTENGPALMFFNQTPNVQVLGNRFERHGAAIDVLFPAVSQLPVTPMMQGAIISNNLFGKGNQSTEPLIKIRRDGGVIVTNNMWFRQDATTLPYENKVLSVSSQTKENLMFTGNVFNINATSSDYYDVNGVTNKTGANIVVNNIVNP